MTQGGKEMSEMMAVDGRVWTVWWGDWMFEMLLINAIGGFLSYFSKWVLFDIPM